MKVHTTKDGNKIRLRDMTDAHVEWLMGWPLGWTDLQPLETGKYRNAQRLHGGAY